MHFHRQIRAPPEITTVTDLYGESPQIGRWDVFWPTPAGYRTCVRVQLEPMTESGGSHGPVVNSCWSTSSRSMPCLVAVDR
jgi:hypothetical protein